jgi:hypothetical protein
MSIISKSSVLTELVSRRLKGDGYNKVEIKGDFPEQDSFINDNSQFIAAQCSRRAGKTNGLALKFLRTMEKHPKSSCLYLSITRETARGIMWDVMLELDAKFKIGCVFTESKLEIKHPNGSKLKLMGADAKEYRKKLKGKKFPAVAIDEAQDFASDQLMALIDDSLTPSISDYEDSWLAITGTPGPVPQGYFFDVTQNGKYGYSIHKWTLLQNPHMPNPEKFIDNLIKKNEWSSTHPSLRREYRNEWVLDAQSLWIQYNENINHYTELPKEHKWNYVLGVDIGFRDADAIAVLAWSETTPETYLIEEYLMREQGVESLMKKIDEMQKKYDAHKIVMDEGGLGKKAAEDYRSRFAVPLEAADKAKKQTNVELLNDYMRLSKFKAKKDSKFAIDSYLIQIDWDRSSPNKVVIKKTYHSDIIDAVLYAFRATYGYTYEKPADKAPRWGSKDWARQQQESMFEQELEGAMRDQEYTKWIKGEYE